MDVELAVAVPSSGSTQVTASVNGVALATNVNLGNGACRGGPAWLGGGFHLASYDNFTVTRL